MLIFVARLIRVNRLIQLLPVNLYTNFYNLDLFCLINCLISMTKSNGMNLLRVLFVMSICIISSNFRLSAQIRNSSVIVSKIYGNCAMCEKKIEKAGNVKNIAQVDWDKDTQLAIITLDSLRTSKQEILKRISDAGYDNELYQATDQSYNNLHKCCKYTRPNKVNVKH